MTAQTARAAATTLTLQQSRPRHSRCHGPAAPSPVDAAAQASQLTGSLAVCVSPQLQHDVAPAQPVAVPAACQPEDSDFGDEHDCDEEGSVMDTPPLAPVFQPTPAQPTLAVAVRLDTRDHLSPSFQRPLLPYCFGAGRGPRQSPRIAGESHTLAIRRRHALNCLAGIIVIADSLARKLVIATEVREHEAATCASLLQRTTVALAQTLTRYTAELASVPLHIAFLPFAYSRVLQMALSC